MACFPQLVIFGEFRSFASFTEVQLWSLSGFNLFYFLLGWGEQWSVMERNPEFCFSPVFGFFPHLWCKECLFTSLWFVMIRLLVVYYTFWVFWCNDWHSSLGVRNLSIKMCCGRFRALSLEMVHYLHISVYVIGDEDFGRNTYFCSQ